MPLQRLKEFYPNYRDAFNGEDIKALDLYMENNHNVGAVEDVLVDDRGHFRYLVICTEVLGFNKKILLPIGSTKINYEAGCITVEGFDEAEYVNKNETP